MVQQCEGRVSEEGLYVPSLDDYRLSLSEVRGTTRVSVPNTRYDTPSKTEEGEGPNYTLNSGRGLQLKKINGHCKSGTNQRNQCYTSKSGSSLDGGRMGGDLGITDCFRNCGTRDRDPQTGSQGFRRFVRGLVGVGSQSTTDSRILGVNEDLQYSDGTRRVSRDVEPFRVMYKHLKLP